MLGRLSDSRQSRIVGAAHPTLPQPASRSAVLAGRSVGRALPLKVCFTNCRTVKIPPKAVDGVIMLRGMSLPDSAPADLGTLGIAQAERWL